VRVCGIAGIFGTKNTCDMSAHTEKTNRSSENRTPATQGSSAKGTEELLGIPDQRPELAAQLKLQQLADRSTAPVQRKENKTGLPDNLKSGIENLSGYAMDDVKVHYNSDKPGKLQAHALAQGSNIHVAPGQEKHLPHEAWHVVQQKQKRVVQTFSYNGVGINDDKSLESEADVMGAKAASNDALVSGEPAQLKEAEADGPAQLLLEEVVQKIVAVLGISTVAALAFGSWLIGTVGILAIGGVWYSREKLNAYFATFNAEQKKKEDSGGAAKGGAAEKGGSAPKSSGGAAKDPFEVIIDAKGLPKVKRDKSVKMTAEQQERFDELVLATNKDRMELKPKKVPSAKSAPSRSKASGGAGSKAAKARHRETMNRLQAEREAMEADDGGGAPQTHRRVGLAAGGAFHVDLFNRAAGTKSRGLAAAAAGGGANKPLAVVYGKYEDAAGDKWDAEVHVHFNDNNPINSHTGAHVKFDDGTYARGSWRAGNASASADLAEILNTGFGGDRWKNQGTYT
jgi:hypothetical protein